MHATIPKGVVGGFELTVLQRNLKERLERQWAYACECYRKAAKVVSTATVEQSIDHIPYFLSGLSRARFFRQPRKIAVYVRFTVFGVVVKVPFPILFAF